MPPSALTYDTSFHTGANVVRFPAGGAGQSLRLRIGADAEPRLPCQLAGAAAIDAGCDGYLYFDAVHPTPVVHQVIAGGGVVRLAAVPEPKTWALLIAGVGLVGAMLRRRRAANAPAAA